VPSWPLVGEPNRVLIGPHSPLAMGVEYAALATAAPASVAQATANLARAYPFVLTEPTLIRKLWWYNGSTASGNIDCGVYTEGGGRLFSTGATAQGTISVIQEVDITDFLLGRGRYYLAISCSSATATLFSNVLSVQLSKMLGWKQMATAHPLPTTFTDAAFSAAIQPIFGLSGRTLVV
jgi:hypothetical protein